MIVSGARNLLAAANVVLADKGSPDHAIDRPYAMDVKTYKNIQGASMASLLAFTLAMAVLAVIIVVVSSDDEVPSQPQNEETSTETSSGQNSGADESGYPLLDLDGATDVDLASEWNRRASETGDCSQPLSIVGTLQSATFEIEALVRETSERLPPDREVELGLAWHESLSRSDVTFLDDQELESYLSELMGVLEELRLGSSYELRPYIVDDPTPNAFVFMGGAVYIHTGLLEEQSWVNNEAQLFNVLAHEVGHLDLRHIALVIEQMERFGLQFDNPNEQLDYSQLLLLVRQAYSREHEVEADVYAYQKMKEAGYSNLQAERSWYAISGGRQRGQAQSDDLFDIFNSELERLQQSHPHALERSCNYRQWLREAPPEYDKAYIGTRNYQELVTAFEQIY